MSPTSGPEAIKAMLITYYPDIAMLAAMIAHSQIVVREPPRVELEHLPAGFDEVDIFILDWIAADARRTRHSITQI